MEENEEVKVDSLEDPQALEVAPVVPDVVPVFVVAPGKHIQCKAGKLRAGSVVTESMVGSAFDSLKKSGAIVAK